MIEQTPAQQIRLNSGACVDCTVTDAELGIRALVGYHHYFQIGVHDAVERVQRAADAAGLSWRAGYAHALPSGGVRVGQVVVHHGDREFVLYVSKRG